MLSKALQAKRNFFVSGIILLLISGTLARAEKALLIGAIPDQHPEKLNRIYNLLAQEMSKELKVSVKYIPVTNYTAAVSAFRTKSIDLVWFGGLTGVQARLQRGGGHVIAQRDIDSNFKSVFVANKGSKIEKIETIRDLKKLKSKRFTFGSESSTSGRLMPQYFLKLAGVNNNDFAGGSAGFSGSHDSTITLVQSGSYEAGALNKQVWDSNLKSKRLRIDKLSVIWTTPPYADYHWLAQPDLDSKFGIEFKVKLKQFFLNLHKKNSDSSTRIMKLFGASKFISADKKQYRSIEDIGRELGKIN
ncbi:putative selenate ABC transporter substrate-binding protein [Prochlorococcus sp. MIT 1341]|uniref:putative selenate ABC transporter substrate-binding protein n=1 Tax=Prochlorococcus sp. MIT 1341 TaxID=3096221 RepID=UPI002A75FC8E|nr:putative selenate ABC transporter substrate-binding protein [Prochlorococcus sp. MIT 1341]